MAPPLGARPMQWVPGVNRVGGGVSCDEVGGIAQRAGDGGDDDEWEDDNDADAEEPWGQNASVAEIIALKNMQYPASSNNSTSSGRR